MEPGGLEDLKALRDEVAKLTFEIIRLSGMRLTLAKKIGEIKAQNNMPIEDPAIEKELKVKVIDFSRRHGIDEGFSLKILDLLLEESKRVQREALELKKHRE
ncbi:MAG: chorismate mutase [Candidatus Bathyarchaeota archaeon]|nr:chorismate mutase [Candidatus Bathyarchaeota archaeon]